MKKKNKIINLILLILIIIFLIFIILYYNNLTDYNKTIIGSWKAINEETLEGTFIPETYVMTFYENGTYLENHAGLEIYGYYKIIKNKIVFYYEPEDINYYLEGNAMLNDGPLEINNNKLIIVFPLEPRTVTFEKINS